MVPEDKILKKLEEIQSVSDRAAQGAKQGSGGMFGSNDNSEYYSTVSELIKQAKAAIHALEHGDQLSQVQNDEAVSSASPGMSAASGESVFEVATESENEEAIVKVANEAEQEEDGGERMNEDKDKANKGEGRD